MHVEVIETRGETFIGWSGGSVLTKSAIPFVVLCLLITTNANTLAEPIQVHTFQAYNSPVFYSTSEHQPIYIAGNENFTSENGVVGGNGTAENPYIIENLRINAISCVGITIMNTRKYFIMRNIEVIGNGSGSFGWFYHATPMLSQNVTNGTFTHITVINPYNSTNTTGIFADGSDLLLEYLTIHEFEIGLECEGNNITVSNSSIFSNQVGMWFFAGEFANISVHHNRVYDNSAGIKMWGHTLYHEYCTIYENIIENNTEAGIFFQGMSLSGIYKNSIRWNKVGIDLFGGGFSGVVAGINITENEILGNEIGMQVGTAHSSSLTGVIRIIHNIIAFSKSYGCSCSCAHSNITENIFWQNNLNNGSQGYDSNYSQNLSYYWNNWSGNYWSDWCEPDSDCDGFVDAPYMLDGNNTSDLKPLARPPFLAVIHNPLTVAYANIPVSFNACVLSSEEIKTVALVYRENSTGAYYNVSMEKIYEKNYTRLYSCNLSFPIPDWIEYYIFATNASGNASTFPYLLEIRAGVPSPPRNLTISVLTEYGRTLKLSWLAPAYTGGYPVTGYNIYRSRDAKNFSCVATVNASTLNFTDTNVSNGVAYYYYVTAVNEFGESEPSNEVSAVPCAVPSPPRNLTAIAGNGSVALSWEPPADDGGMAVTNYTIYYGTNSGNYTMNMTVANLTSYTITGLSNGQRYYFVVSANNGVGESEKSNEVSAVPCTLPSAPRNLTAVAGNRNVTLTWEPPADNGGMSVTNYTVYYGTTPGNYTNNITVGNITSYTITGLINGQRYYFVVSAINSVGESEKSTESSAMPCTVPSAPQNLTTVAGNGNVTLTWEPPADNGGMPITGYRIYYGTSSGNYTVNITVDNVSTYTLINLTSGQKYFFAVCAINPAGESAKSNEVSVTPRAEPNPTYGFDVLAYIYAGVVCIGIIMLGRKKRR